MVPTYRSVSSLSIGYSIFTFLHGEWNTFKHLHNCEIVKARESKLFLQLLFRVVMNLHYFISKD